MCGARNRARCVVLNPLPASQPIAAGRTSRSAYCRRSKLNIPRHPKLAGYRHAEVRREGAAAAKARPLPPGGRPNAMPVGTRGGLVLRTGYSWSKTLSSEVLMVSSPLYATNAGPLWRLLLSRCKPWLRARRRTNRAPCAAFSWRCTRVGVVARPSTGPLLQFGRIMLHSASQDSCFPGALARSLATP